MASKSFSYNEDFHTLTTSNKITFDMNALGRKCDDPEMEAERKEIRNAVYQLQLDVDEFIEKSTKSAVQRLQDKRELLVPQCKAAKKHYDSLVSKQSYFQDGERRLSEQVNVAHLNLNAAKQTVLTPAYSSAQDYLDLEAKIESLREKAVASVEAYNAHMRLYNAFDASLNSAAEAHNSLVKQEAYIRNEIDKLLGKEEKQFDSATGLQTTNERPVTFA